MRVMRTVVSGRHREEWRNFLGPALSKLLGEGVRSIYQRFYTEKVSEIPTTIFANLGGVAVSTLSLGQMQFLPALQIQERERFRKDAERGLTRIQSQYIAILNLKIPPPTEVDAAIRDCIRSSCLSIIFSDIRAACILSASAIEIALQYCYPEEVKEATIKKEEERGRLKYDLLRKALDDNRIDVLHDYESIKDLFNLRNPYAHSPARLLEKLSFANPEAMIEFTTAIVGKLRGAPEATDFQKLP